MCVVKSFIFSCLGSDASGNVGCDARERREERERDLVCSRKHTFSNFLFHPTYFLFLYLKF